MKCSKANDYMMKYMDKLLTEEEARKLNAHLHECEECKEAFFTYEMIGEELESMGTIKAPDDFELAVMEKINDIVPEYEADEKTSLDNILGMVWGIFSLVFGIGMLMVIYQETIIDYLLTNPYTNQWVKHFIPTIELATDYVMGMKQDISEMIKPLEQILQQGKLILIPILIGLGIIQYILYRKTKVEV